MTLVSDFRDPTRAFLGDFNAAVRRYADTAIDSVVRTIIQCGHLPTFALDPTKTQIVPDILQPRDFAVLTYRTCISFIRPNAARYSYDRRAMKESFGDQIPMLVELGNELYEVENSAQFSSFQNFASWATAITGIDVWAYMTDLQANAPVAKVTVGRDGIKVVRS